MNDKPKFKHEQAMDVARDVVKKIGPACEQIAIAGSLRRGKEEVKDIEILLIPRYAERPLDMFSQRVVSVADEVIEQLLNDGYFTKRPSKIGVFTWGESNKLAIHSASGILVDLFSTNKKCWNVALVIRTGSKENNFRLATCAQNRNRKLHAYGGISLENGEMVFPASEQEVFEYCGVPYLEPNER